MNNYVHVLLTVLTLAGCAEPAASAAVDASHGAKPIKVESEEVTERSVPRYVPLTGTLTAELRTELTANATGRVIQTFVERGQKVERGALLAQLDVRSASASAAEAQASVESAKLQLDAARAECARYDELVARGAITDQEHAKQAASCKQQLAAVAVSQARASSAALVVGDGTIRAPFSGVVSERMAMIGDYVQPSTKVARLVVSNPLRLMLTVPERRIGEVRKDALVTFQASGLPGQTFSGTVKYLSGEVRSTTRDVVVEATVPNADGRLLPGMFVEVQLHAGSQVMPIVPKSALFSTGREQSVYLVRDKHLQLQLVKTGVQAGKDVAIEEGVRAGDVVVINPSAQLSDDTLVE